MPSPPPPVRSARPPSTAPAKAVKAPKAEKSAKVKGPKHGKPEPPKASSKPKAAAPKVRARRRSRIVIPVVGSVFALAVLFVGVFPTRAVLAQRREVAEARSRLAGLDATNEALRDRVDALGTDAEIERIAREQYNLVFPGEEAYALLPAPEPTPARTGDGWSIVQRTLAALTP
jgi:cell division protein FtsB